jgi:glutathione S-transferase
MTKEPQTNGTLLPENENEQLTTRWEEIQASFVDKPQESVEEADALVADLMQRVTYGLTKERERLEKQWAAGDDVSTEDLRVALKRYRTFFDRLLKA